MKKYTVEYVSTLYQAAQEKGSDSSLVGVLELDNEGKIAEFNNVFCEFLHYPVEQLKNSFWMDYVFPEDLADAKYFFDRMASNAIAKGHVNLRFQKSDGIVIWLKLSIAPVSKAHSQNHILLLEDITEAHRKENYLQDTIHRMKSLFDAMSEGVMFLSSEGKVLSYNKRAPEIFDFTIEELEGKCPWIPKGEFLSEDQTAIAEDQFPSLVARKTGRSIHDYVFQKTRGDGKFIWISMNVNPIFDSVGEQGTGVVCTFADITKRKESESQLMHSAKLATLGEMSASIAHEIKNPLAVIHGKVSSLLRKKDAVTGIVTTKESDLELIKTTADRINKIIKGLKAFSRSGEGDPYEVANFHDLLEDARNLVDEKFKSAGVEFRVVSGDPIYFECRFVQVSQVVINLLNNAFDAIQEKEDKWIELKVGTFNDKFFEVTVTDCGPGIPEDVVKRLMNPFFTTKGRGKGTGLGLSISKKIIESHHGEFFLDRSSPNTKFVIRLPYNQAAPSEGSSENSDSQVA